MNWRFWTWFDWKDGMWGPDPYNGTLVRSDMERFEVLGDDRSPEAVAQAKSSKDIEVEITFPDGSVKIAPASKFWEVNASWWDAQTAHIPFADEPQYTD